MIDNKLITFLSLCETKSYTRTAETLYITQPSVTHHIKTLEKMYDINLFIPGKHFNLTPEGKLIYKYAEKCLELDKEFENCLRTCQEKIEYLNLGVTYALGSCFMSPIIKRWITKHPKDKVTMRLADYNDLTGHLSSGIVDFAVIDNNYDKSNYDNELIYTANIVLAVGKNHPLSIGEKITLDKLLKEKFIFPSQDCGIKDTLSLELKAKNYPLDIIKNAIEINDTIVIKQMVQDGLGVSLFYDCDIAKEVEQGLLFPVEVINIKKVREFHAIYNKDHLEKERIKRMIKELVLIKKEINYKRNNEKNEA